MIDRREIIDTATALSLRPDVVEKDYVLGWLLAGISNHEVLRESWVFKGGTCLKKCFFEMTKALIEDTTTALLERIEDSCFDGVGEHVLVNLPWVAS